MKQLLAILLALPVLLAGCGTPGTHTPAGTQAGTAATGAFPETATATEAPLGDDAGDAALAEENRWLGGFSYRTARIGDVLYFAEYGAPNVPMLLALDLNTMECFPLCARPECEHNSTDCGAYAGGFGSPVQLTAWWGQLYFLDHVLPHNILYRIDADGSNRVRVMELSDLSNPVGGYADTWFGIHEGMFYHCVLGQYVEDADVRQTAVLYRQPLEGGSADRAEELLRVDGAERIVACIEGSTLYCAVHTYDPEQECYVLTVWACDLERGGLTELWQGQAPFAQTMAYRDGMLVFGYGEAFAFSLAEKALVPLPVSGSTAMVGDGVYLLFPESELDAETTGLCRVLDGDGRVLYEGRYYPERYETVNSMFSLESKYVMTRYAGFSEGRFYFHLFYMEYGRYEYALLVFDAETFICDTPFVLDWPHEEYHGTVTITDDDGNTRVYDSVTGRQLSGPPEETSGEE